MQTPSLGTIPSVPTVTPGVVVAGSGIQSSPTPPAGDEKESTSPTPTNSPSTGITATDDLDLRDRRILEQLKTQDRRVRQHEHAHIVAGGRYITSGARFEYKQGPDGRRYVVSGEVSISTSPESTPEATLEKARTIRRAALAPADPSPQDRAVAVQASRMEAQAQKKISESKAQETADNRPVERERENSQQPDDAKRTAAVPTASSIEPLPPSVAVGGIIDVLG